MIVNESVNENPSMPPIENVTQALSNDERTWALLAHLSAFSAFISGIGCILGPMIVWLVKRDSLPFASEQAKEALNFNITVALGFVALVILTIGTFGLFVLFAVPIGLALFVAWVVLTVIAALKVNEGVAYRYPFTLRLVK